MTIAEVVAAVLKKCSVCGVDRPHSSFNVNSRVTGVLRPQCQTCQEESNAVGNEIYCRVAYDLIGERSVRNCHAQIPKEIRSETYQIIRQKMIEEGELCLDSEGRFRLVEGSDLALGIEGFVVKHHHTYPEGEGHSLSPPKERQPGETDQDVNDTESWIYGVLKDPWMWEDCFKIGNTRQQPEKYVTTRYRYALDSRHPNAHNLFFTLIYKAKRNGRTIERRIQRKLRKLGIPTDRPEEVLFESLEHFRAAMMSVCAGEPDLELWYDEFQSGWIKGQETNPLTVGANSATIEHHGEI